MTPFDIDTAIRYVDPYRHDDGEALAIRLGISTDAIRRARKHGHMALTTAERIAQHVGVHVGDIWPAYWDWTIERERAKAEHHNQRQRGYQAALRAARRRAA